MSDITVFVRKKKLNLGDINLFLKVIKSQLCDIKPKL